jgi:hypothetical protein
MDTTKMKHLQTIGIHRIIFKVEFIIQLLIGSMYLLSSSNVCIISFGKCLPNFWSLPMHFSNIGSLDASTKVERYLNTGIVTKQKPTGRRSTLNEEVVEDIRTHMQRNPDTSMRRLSLPPIC